LDALIFFVRRKELDTDTHARSAFQSEVRQGSCELRQAIRGMPGSEFEPRSPLQKETPPTRVVFLFGAFSICAANRPPAATFIEKRRETRKGFPRKHPLPREERRILHSSDEKNLLPTPMREAHFNQR